MSFHDFSSDDFDAVDWVNAALAQDDSNDKSNELIRKLQTFVHKINAELERICQDLVRDLPGIARSVEVVHHEVQSLKSSMQAVGRDLENVEQNTAETMASLLQLDTVKTRMAVTATAVQEAQNLSNLATQIDAALESTDVQEVASALLSLQRSVLVLGSDSDLGDHELQQQQLQALTARLRSLARPRLLEAIQRRDVAAAAATVTLFQDMALQDDAESAFQKAIEDGVQTQWTTLRTAEGPGGAIQAMIDELCANFHNDVEFVRTVFRTERPEERVSMAYSEALAQLQPSMKATFSELVDSAPGPFRLAEVARVRQHARRQLEHRAVSWPSLRPVLQTIGTYQDGFSSYMQADLAKLLLASNATGTDDEQAADADADAGEATDLVEEPESKAADLNERLRARCGDFIARWERFVPLALTVMQQLDERTCLPALLQAIAAVLDTWSQETSVMLDKANVLPELPATSGKSVVRSEDFHYAFSLVQHLGDCVAAVQGLEPKLSTVAASAVSAAEQTAAKAAAAGTMEHKHQAPDTLLGKTREVQRQMDVLKNKLYKNEPILGEAVARMTPLSNRMHRFALDYAVAPLQSDLKAYATQGNWTTIRLDDPKQAALPTPRISQIGEIILQMPQLMEPHFEMPGVKALMDCCTLDIFHVEGATEVDDRWVDALARRICNVVVEASFLLPNGVPADGRKQLAADFDYVCNVLTAFDATPAPALIYLVQLLGQDKVEESAQSRASEVPDGKAILQLIHRLRKN